MCEPVISQETEPGLKGLHLLPMKQPFPKGNRNDTVILSNIKMTTKYLTDARM